MRSEAKLRLGVALVCGMVLASAIAAVDAKAQKKIAKIDGMADAALKRLYHESPAAQHLMEKAYGYAVFDVRQTKFMVAGGGGDGVAVERSTSERTYMKQASLGVGVGLGIQKYKVVFMFEDAAHFHSFVDEGWEASAGANGVAGDRGQNAGVSATDAGAVGAGANSSGVGFVGGLAVFQMTDKGLMLQADISGTKYWQPDRLND
jgi:lipid-binding SYLF domain-containing protein